MMKTLTIKLRSKAFFISEKGERDPVRSCYALLECFKMAIRFVIYTCCRESVRITCEMSFKSNAETFRDGQLPSFDVPLTDNCSNISYFFANIAKGREIMHVQVLRISRSFVRR